MPVSKKRISLLAGTALALAGITCAVAGGSGSTGATTARLATAPVQAQRADFVPQLPPKSILIKATNHGAYTGRVCVENTTTGEECSADVNVLQKPTELLATINDNDTNVVVRGNAQGGRSITRLVPADGQVHCFLFDGTVQINFGFTEAGC